MLHLNWPSIQKLLYVRLANIAGLEDPHLLTTCGHHTLYATILGL